MLAEHVGRAAAGQGSTLSVLGEPGVGKTTLLDEVEAQGADLGLAVVRARAEEFERDRPFGLVRRLTRSLPVTAAGALTAAVGDLALPEVEPEQEHRMADTFVQAIERCAVRRPVLVLVDDLHWADDPSVLALRSLSSGLPARAVCLVVAARVGAGSARCRGLLATVDRERRCDLGPLSDADVRRLVGRVIGADPCGELIAALRRADGIPSFVLALAADWASRGPTRSVPASVQESVERQLATLPDDATRILRLVALAARPVSFAEITAAIDRPVLEVADLIEAVVRRRLLVDEGICLRYRHDLVRQAVVESTPLAVREAMQSLIAVAPPAGSRSSGPATPADLGALTRAERRIVDLVAVGMTNLDIAETLSISRRTVESHLYRAYPKLGVGSRLELAVLVGRSP